ncbi:MAG: adenylosuccinate synthetase, partial [Deltaproteobacteria bacterium]|nr:adenylosuccinate synthetase [Deltaproteobacteria bacterium]
VTSYRRLPKVVRSYLDRIAELTETPIDIVSVGPDRAQTIVLRNPYLKEAHHPDRTRPAALIGLE